MCEIPHSSLTCVLLTDIPLRCLENESADSCKERLSDLLRDKKCGSTVLVCVVCRRGNDSQLAVAKLKKYLNQSNPLFDSITMEIRDIVGGLTEWTNSIDPQFPKY